MITPALNLELDVQETQGKAVIRIQVPTGENRPYAIDNNKIYVRDETETTLAVRDEIVNLVRQSLLMREPAPTHPAPVETVPEITLPPLQPGDDIKPPRAGVEIINIETRDGLRYYTMHDLRNGNTVKNVTMNSARRLWHYAIKQLEANPLNLDDVVWNGDIGLWRRYKKGGDVRYDLVQRVPEGIRIYYGVTENGMEGPWHVFLDPEETAPV